MVSGASEIVFFMVCSRDTWHEGTFVAHNLNLRHCADIIQSFSKVLNLGVIHLGHFQVGSYRYRSLIEESVYLMEAL